MMSGKDCSSMRIAIEGVLLAGAVLGLAAPLCGQSSAYRVPRATYIPQPFQILQSASQLVIAYQYAGAVRNIYFKDPGPAPVDSWMGQSFGRWEGETLIVDVTGFNDQSWFDRAGNFHSDALHVVERSRRTSPDVIAYEATIEDPQVTTRPWNISMPLYRRQEKNAQIL